MSMSSNIKGNINEYSTHEGRITRGTYVLRVIGRWVAFGIAMLCIQLFVILGDIVIDILNYNYLVVMLGTSLIMFMVAVIFFFLKIVQEMKRLHDMNSSGWGIIFGFIPVVNIIYYLLLILNDGTVGSNKYGEDPKGRIKN